MTSLQTYLIEIQWQIFRLSEHRHLDEFLEEIIDKLKKLCRVKNFNVYGEFLSFDIILEAEGSDEAEKLAKTYTRDSYVTVLNGSQMILVDVIVKELPSTNWAEVERFNQVHT